MYRKCLLLFFTFVCLFILYARVCHRGHVEVEDKFWELVLSTMWRGIELRLSDLA